MANAPKEKTKASKIRGSMIDFCTCTYPVQDALYGQGRRVFNSAPGNAGKNPRRFRCTVCKREKEV